MDLAIDEAIAIGNGILTVENDEQAWARARVDGKNKGGAAAEAALRMIALRAALQSLMAAVRPNACRTRRQAGQPARRGAAGRRAGALPDGPLRGDAARGDRRVRDLPARQGGRRRPVSQRRCRLLPRHRRRRRARPEDARPGHRPDAGQGLAADPHRHDAARHPARRRLRTGEPRRRALARGDQRICRRRQGVLRGRCAGGGQRGARRAGPRAARRRVRRAGKRA